MKTKILTFAFLLLTLVGCGKKEETFTINTSYGAWELETYDSWQYASIYLPFNQDFTLDEDGETLLAPAPFARFSLVPFFNGTPNGKYKIIKLDPSNPGEANLYIDKFQKDMGWMTSGTVEISDGKIVCNAKNDVGQNVVINFKGTLKFSEYGIDETIE